MKNTFIFFLVSLFIVMLLIPSIYAQSDNSVAGEINIPISQLATSEYFYNPDNIQNLTGNNTIMIPQENLTQHGVGILMTSKQITDYLNNAKSIPKGYHISEIRSFQVTMTLNITDLINETMATGNTSYIYIYTGNNYTPNNGIMLGIHKKNANEFYISPSSTIVSGESFDIHLNEAPTNYTFNMDTTVYVVNAQATSYVSYYNVLHQINSTAKKEYSATFGATVYNKMNYINLATYINSTESEAWITESVITHFNVVIEENKPVAKAFINIVEWMIGIGIVLLVIGLYNYNKEVFKGTSIAVGLALLLTGISLYFMTSWWVTWLPVLLPLTLSIFFLYLMFYTKAIDTATHVAFEYWMLKWGDALTLIFLVLTIVEMWSGVFAHVVVPFWLQGGV